MSTAIFMLATGFSVIGTSAAHAGICNGAELLQSSSTIKGVTFTKGTRLANSYDFNGNSLFTGSVSLTADQASGTGTTSITATAGATATWLYVSPSISSWGNSDISTTDNHQNVTFINGRIFEIKISGSGCTDYYRLNIRVTGSSSSSSSSSSAQNTAATDAATAAVAIAKATLVLTTQFSNNKPASLEQFSEAGYGVRNQNVAAKASAAILKLPAKDRDNAQKLNEIISLENFIDRVAGIETRSTVRSTELVSRGLLPVESTYKHSVVQGLASYPNGSLDSLEKIAAAVKEQIEKAEAPKRRTAEIRARIAARNK